MKWAFWSKDKCPLQPITKDEAANAASRHKISASILGQIKWFKDSDMALDSFAYELVNGPKPSRTMKIGTAWHRTLEEAADKFMLTGKSFTVDDRISKYDIDFDIKTRIEIPAPIETEKRVVRYFMLDGEAIRISAVIDAVLTDRLVEYKTSKRTDAMKYFESMQWRIYLFLMNQYQRLDYYIFQITDRNDLVTIRNQQILSTYWAPVIQEDIVEAIREAVRYYKVAGVRTNDRWQLEFE